MSAHVPDRARRYTVTWREWSNGSVIDRTETISAYTAADAVTQIETSKRGLCFNSRSYMGPTQDTFDRVLSVEPEKT